MTPLEALRLLIGLPLVLLVPGWAWSLALFPRRPPAFARGPSNAAEAPQAVGMDRPGDAAGLGLVERLVVSFGLSIALVPLVALACSAGLGLPLGTWGSVTVVALVTGGGVLVWRLREGRHKPATVN